MLLVGVATVLAGPARASVVGSATIASDLLDYPPGATVTLTGQGWAAGESVHIVVNDTIGQTWQHVVDKPAQGDGTVSDVFSLPNYFVSDYDVTATGPISGTATTTFTDASAASLDQCANDPAPSPNSDGCSVSASDWVSGNVGASKANYLEGDFIPYRIVMTGLTTGAHSITVEWDTTKAGKHALDYIGTFNETVATANPCLGVAGCSSSATFPIPADLQVTGAGVTPLPGNFTLYGGTITSVTAPTDVGSTSCSALTLGSYCYSSGTGFGGDKSAAIQINFSASVANPVLAWAGHIASRQNWGVGNGAVNIPGSPFHSRLIDLDGSGGNQDRSLSNDAVTFPGSITIIKQATPEGSTSFPFTASPLPLSNFNLVDDGTSTNTTVFPNITNFQTYGVAESAPAGWTLTGIVCSVTDPNGGSRTVTSPSVSINLKEGENVTCTYTNQRQAAHLIVIKHVVNNNGGTSVASNFTMTINGVTADGGNSFPGAESPGTDKTLSTVGSYSVTESGPSGYADTYSADCTGTIAFGQTKTCTITNDDLAAHLKLVKTVTNDNGGTAVKTDFVLSAAGPTPVSGAGGADSDVSAGSYGLSETNVPGYTAGAWSCVGGTQTGASVALALGQSATCAINNDDIAPKLHLRKVIVNDNGGTKTVADFTLTANGTGTNDLSGPSPVNSGPGLKADTWALSETSVYGYTASAWVCVGGTMSGANVTVAVGGEATCTITNDDQPGKIVVIKNAKPAQGSFAFTTTGTGYNGFTLTGATTNGGNVNTQSLNAGSYTVKEATQLGWILTGIGGSIDPSTPYSCVVTGTGGSSGLGDLTAQTATISLKNVDTVTCTFENTGQGVTRTQGFWATHSPLANSAWFGGTAFGHTFPGVGGTAGIGDTLLCGRPIDTVGKLMGGFWSDIAKKSTGAKRSSLDQARMQLLQQLLAAELNASAFGSVPAGGSGQFAVWEAAYCGTNQSAMQNALQGAASFNNAGDSASFTPGTSADSKNARTIANKVFWDTLP